MARVPDYYTARAHKEQYLARSVYKLAEINEKHKLLQPGDRVLDLGCAPGSWLQYSSKIVGPTGFVLGLDIQVIPALLPENVKTLQADILSLDFQKFREQWGTFSVILSDMAPHTTGTKVVDQQRSLELARSSFNMAEEVLDRRGNYLVKIFQSDDSSGFFSQVKDRFRKGLLIKPRSSRKESFELYILGLDKKQSVR